MASCVQRRLETRWKCRVITCEEIERKYLTVVEKVVVLVNVVELHAVVVTGYLGLVSIPIRNENWIYYIPVAVGCCHRIWYRLVKISSILLAFAD